MEFGNFPIFHSFILYFSRHMSYYKICVCGDHEFLGEFKIVEEM